MIKLRWYQEEAAQALYKAVKKKDCHPVAALPTGSGKSFTICEFCDLWLSDFPESNILILSHVSEILQQNAASLEKYFEGLDVGLYSAGLASKTIHKITVGGIQTVYSKPELFSHFDVIIIDEAHRVPLTEDTMYQKFLSEIDATFVGLTATPFRLGNGYIYKGDGALFNELCYDLTSMENYNRLVEEGHLAEMYTANTFLKLDAKSKKVKVTAGDYNDKALSKAFDRKSITERAISEAVKFIDKTNRKQTLVFAIDIKHAENIAEELGKYGLKVICIHSKMKGGRKKAIKDIKLMKYDVIVNVDVLTTGFDHPMIDLIVDLKPTKSPVQHIQKLGRGARPFPYEDGFCLIMDFAGNVATLGPINNVVVVEKEKGEPGSGEPIQKICSECQCYNFPSVRFCVNCGHEFIFVEKIKETAFDGDVIQKSKKQWLKVTGIKYSISQKPGRPDSLRVMYSVGMSAFSEWVNYEHNGFAGHIARNWVKYRLGTTEIPSSLNELYPLRFEFKIPSEIEVDNTGKFPRITNYRFI